MSSVAQFLLDVLIAILLVATICYCVLLNRRLTALRDSNDDFRSLVQQLESASMKAEKSASSMKLIGETAMRGLQEKINEANALTRALAVRPDHAREPIEDE